ncbi:MAG: hypothetical protein ABJN62_18205 [Halioglobus sp.]
MMELLAAPVNLVRCVKRITLRLLAMPARDGKKCLAHAMAILMSVAVIQAHALRVADRIGSLEVGKLADRSR